MSEPITEQQIFINAIAPIIRREAFLRGYKYPSAIIAQACLESNFGRSKLSAEYHNYFGLKAGSSWTGRRVNMATKEEYTVGNLTSIHADFRAYDSMEQGVIGYFDFINTSRYANLKSAVDAKSFLELIKGDGYATSSGYVNNNYNVIEKYNLMWYDWIKDPDFNKAIDYICAYVIGKAFGNGHELRKNMIYDIIRARTNEIVKEMDSK